MVLITAPCTMSPPSNHSSSGTLLDIIPWIYLSLSLYNHKGFDLYHNWMASFPNFVQFKIEFCNKEFMIWATVSSWPCFCWLYRASPCLAAKNIIKLISVLTIWWGPCVVFSCVVGRGWLLWPVCSLGKTVRLCPASFFIPRPNLPFTPGISWLTTFAFQSFMVKQTPFWGVNSRMFCRSS